MLLNSRGSILLKTTRVEHSCWLGKVHRETNRIISTLLFTCVFVTLSNTPVVPRVFAESPSSFPVPPPSSATQIAPPAPGPPELIVPEPGIPPDANVRVNTNLATLTRPQVEPSVASNPTNPFHLVTGFADSQDDPVAFDTAPGVARSTDGGRTWVRPSAGATLPNPPGFTWGSRTLASFLAAGDSAVAWGPGNVTYFSTLGFHDNQNPPGNDCSGGGIYVYWSTNGGDTWTLPANGPAIGNTQTVFRDKEYIAVDANPSSPFAGRLYMVWDDDVYSGCPQMFFGASRSFVRRDIAFSASPDEGATWSPPIILATGCLVAPVPAVAANGALYVVWYDCNSGIRQMVRKSTDGGVSFGPPIAAAWGLAAPPNPLVGSKFRVNAAFPVIATDPTNASNVYVAWSSNNGPGQTDVFVSRSLDGGATWSPTPTRVSDDPLGNPRDQFFPWIAVGSDGTVRVSWGDDRRDLANPGGKLYDIFIAESTDKGASFGPNIQVTTVSSNPDFDGFGGTFIGDYFGLSASGVSVWGDTRNGNQDIFGALPPVPLVSIATNNSVYRAGDRMVVTVTTEPGLSTANWYLVVALVTPMNTPANPLFLYRFNPVVEFLTLQQALSRPPNAAAARPLQAVRFESFVVLDVALPDGLPAGSYQWLVLCFSADLSRISNVATASLTLLPAGTPPPRNDLGQVAEAR